MAVTGEGLEKFEDMIVRAAETTATHGRVRAHQRRRTRANRSRLSAAMPATPRSSSGGATIISSRCCSMWIEKR